MKKKRLVWLTIFGLFLLSVSILKLSLNLLTSLGFLESAAHFDEPTSSLIPRYPIFLVIDCILLLGSIGLLLLKKWGRLLILITFTVYLIDGIFIICSSLHDLISTCSKSGGLPCFIMGGIFSIPQIIIMVLLPMGCIYFLTKSRIKEQFN